MRPEKLIIERAVGFRVETEGVLDIDSGDDCGSELSATEMDP